LASTGNGAGATGLSGVIGATGGLGAETEDGGTGAAGAVDGGIGGFEIDGGATAEAGAFGIAGMEGIPAGGSGGTMAPGADGGFGIEGAAGMEIGGFNPAGTAGGVARDGAEPETGTGFGGRLIIAVSRGLEAMGEPSRRAGRTILTVSFLGSAIFCSEWVKGQLYCGGMKYLQIPARLSMPVRKIVACSDVAEIFPTSAFSPAPNPLESLKTKSRCK
jgi:hypothetical protein